MKYLIPILIFGILFTLFFHIYHHQKQQKISEISTAKIDWKKGIYKTDWITIYFDPETKKVIGYDDYLKQTCVMVTENISLFEFLATYTP